MTVGDFICAGHIRTLGGFYVLDHPWPNVTANSGLVLKKTTKTTSPYGGKAEIKN